MTTTDNSLEQAWSRDTVDRQVRDRMAQTVFKATGDLDRGMLGRMLDHIAPWRSCYMGARLPSGDVRFVLSNSGHIAGIVNPPNPKSRHYIGAGDDLPADPGEWLAEATMHPVTWWEDWATWIEKRAGDQRTPPPLGSKRNPILGDAPGAYIFGS